MKKLLCGLAGLLWLSMAQAAVPAWQIVPSQSNLNFSATQNNAPVTGQFKNFSGEIYFDPTQLTNSHVKMTIDLASVTTSYSEIGTILATADWFDVKDFPQAIFTADHFTALGNNSYQATGNLSLRGKTLPIMLNFTLTQYTGTHAIAKGTAVIKRTQFGVGQGQWADTKAIKDDVQVNFVLTASH